VTTRIVATALELARRSGRFHRPDSAGSATAPPLPPRLPVTDVDLSSWSVARIEELTPVQRSTLGQHGLRLTLPPGVSAASIREWLRACPKLQAITALDIREDGALISAARAADLRAFKTTPPGPSQLCLGLGAELLVPDDQVEPPDLSRLEAWVANPETLPRLSPETFGTVNRLIRCLLFDSVNHLRDGLIPGPGLRQAMLALLAAAPAELLSGVAARNHAAVVAFVGAQYRIGYREFLNFVRPTLKACWETAVSPRPPFGHEPRPLQELQVLAALRAWALRATPQESVGQRERVVRAAVLAGLRDVQAIAHLLKASAEHRDDDTLASPPVSPVSSIFASPLASAMASPIASPITSPIASPIVSPGLSPFFAPVVSPGVSPATSPVISHVSTETRERSQTWMPLASSTAPSHVAALSPPGTPGSDRGW
jgi:hypothetical protein